MLTLAALELESVINWIWLIIFIATIVFEMATVELTSIWFSAGSIFALIFSALGLAPAWQIGIFFVTSFILLATVGKYGRKALKNNKISTNIDSFIGKEIIVLEDADFFHPGEGKVNGTIWTISCEQNISVAKGDIAVIKEIQGNKLIVVKKEN